MKLFFTTTEDNAFQIGPTPVGRLVAASERFAMVFLFAIFAGGIFFLPDYLGRYRQNEPEPGFHVYLLLICGLFVAFVASLVRFVRKEVWVLDLDEDMLVYETSRMLGGFQQAGVDLDDVEYLAYEPAAFPGTSGIYVTIEGAERVETICESRFSHESIRTIAESLESFIDERGWDIDHDLSADASK
ncbi:MAG: hypothetical protein ACQEVA_10450 [Myxococcota bacterium]